MSFSEIGVSYARADDQSIYGEAEGWVTTFIKRVEKRLCSKLERTVRIECLPDQNEQAISDVLEIIPQIPFLLVIVSRNYLASNWCQKEQNTGRLYSSGGRTLPALLYSKIVEFLTSIPNIEESHAQRALLYSTGIDPELEHQINFAVPSAQFFQLLVQTLNRYGKLHDGRNALSALLEATKNSVGQERRAYCDTLIQKVQAIVTEEEQHPSSQSGWPQQNFLHIIRKRTYADSSVFLIERDRLTSEEYPAELNAITGYRYPFWDNARYHNLITDLCYDLTDNLHKFYRLQRHTQTFSKTIPLTSNECPTVFLADVTDDLYEEWQDVRSYLEHMDLYVLPKEPYDSYEPQTFQNAVRADLANSQFFVQLLSAITGKRPKNLQKSRARYQYELAMEAHKPIIQWRPPELDVETVQDHDQHALLKLDTVLAMELEQFKAELVKRIVPPPSDDTISPDMTQIALLLFLDANLNEDAGLVTQICQMFDQFGVGYTLPLQSDKPVENREAFEQYVLECTALVVLYGEVSVKWVSDQLLTIRKIFWKREQPLTAFAIFDGPPEHKPPVTFKLPNMRVIECRDCLDEQKVLDFIESVQKGA